MINNNTHMKKSDEKILFFSFFLFMNNVSAFFHNLFRMQIDSSFKGFKIIQRPFFFLSRPRALDIISGLYNY